MSSLIEKLVHDTIEEYERLAEEYDHKADALRAEWRALNRPVDQSVDQSVDPDGWIEWGGGDCPVGVDDRVMARFSDGSIDSAIAGQWYWTHHGGGGGDIVAYRIIKEEA